ncbi:Single-stranded DNA-binding protein [Wickerhamomyces ciferrii]|uniref:Single-stranded DNA-binding protein n=1 Tax=Wickerhamomyces ciferrii (strain ATCC 14091 / BCRC 22168 / CBS 111 / JCM 3599 / NBRC 0793 / NRRL Y-1031 F-60-10) TaxID=1206466 RepID=K0KJY2_WICCF|nr:Single-stranded DNA-binding protein [Wickerhamomyces ciferrii]CCH42472.1 Single-stranded DNA-binding protein [Wickerhamomyces ciferrii]
MFRSIATSGLRTTKAAAPFATRNASSFASSTIIGRLGQDFEVREGANGKKYLPYSIAVNKYNKDAPPNWFPIVVFNEQQIDFLTTYAKKGALLHVEATPDIQVYETEDGQKQYRTSFIQSMYS